MLDLVRPEVKSFYEKLSTDDDTLTIDFYIEHMRRFTATVPARGARARNRAISNSCL